MSDSTTQRGVLTTFDPDADGPRAPLYDKMTNDELVAAARTGDAGAIVRLIEVVLESGDLAGQTLTLSRTPGSDCGVRVRRHVYQGRYSDINDCGYASGGGAGAIDALVDTLACVIAAREVWARQDADSGIFALARRMARDLRDGFADARSDGRQ